MRKRRSFKTDRLEGGREVARWNRTTESRAPPHTRALAQGEAIDLARLTTSFASREKNSKGGSFQKSQRISWIGLTVCWG